jgi:hypothetical protein
MKTLVKSIKSKFKKEKYSLTKAVHKFCFGVNSFLLPITLMNQLSSTSFDAWVQQY